MVAAPPKFSAGVSEDIDNLLSDFTKMLTAEQKVVFDRLKDAYIDKRRTYLREYQQKRRAVDPEFKKMFCDKIKSRYNTDEEFRERQKEYGRNYYAAKKAAAAAAAEAAALQVSGE